MHYERKFASDRAIFHRGHHTERDVGDIGSGAVRLHAVRDTRQGALRQRRDGGRLLPAARADKCLETMQIKIKPPDKVAFFMFGFRVRQLRNICKAKA